MQEESNVRGKILSEMDSIYGTTYRITQPSRLNEVTVVREYLKALLSSDVTVNLALKAWRAVIIALCQQLPPSSRYPTSKVFWIHSIGRRLMRAAVIGDEVSAVTEANLASFDSQASPQLSATLPAVFRQNMAKIGLSEDYSELQQALCRHRLVDHDLIVSTGTPAGKASAVCMTVSLAALDRKQPSVSIVDIKKYIVVLRSPVAIILCPNRELAIVNFDLIQRLCDRTYAIPHIAVGGESIEAQLDNLRKGCDILVATPGRLVHLSEKHPFSEVKLMVLDEAVALMHTSFETTLGSL